MYALIEPTAYRLDSPALAETLARALSVSYMENKGLFLVYYITEKTFGFCTTDAPTHERGRAISGEWVGLWTLDDDAAIKPQHPETGEGSETIEATLKTRLDDLADFFGVDCVVYVDSYVETLSDEYERTLMRNVD